MADPLDLLIEETTFFTGFGEWTYERTGKTAKRCWLIVASRDLNYADIDTVAGQLPVQLGEAYTDGDTRYCTKLTFKAIASTTDTLYAEAEFGPNQYEPNPLMRKDRISLEVAGETVDWFLDADSKPAVTTAGEVFEKIPPRTQGGVKLVIEGNRSFLPAADMVGFSRPHRTNSSQITVRGVSIPAGSAKLIGCSGGEQTENGVTFYTCRWELALAETWEIDLDSRGLMEKGDDGKLKPIRKGAQNAVVEMPWPLDANGKSKPNATDVPAKVHLKPYMQTDFGFGWTAAL